MALNDHRKRMDGIVRRLVVAIVKLLRSVSGRQLNEQQRQDLIDVLRDALEGSRKDAHAAGWAMFLAQRAEHDTTEPPPGQPPMQPLAREYVEKVLKTNLPRIEVPDQADKGISDFAGTASRSVEDAARAVTMRAVGRDPEAKGYARVLTGRETCGFCALLASRGAVYEKDSFDASNRKFVGEGIAKTHDRCDCIMVPVFDLYSWPGRDEYLRLSKLYADSTKDKRGKNAIKAFREAYESPKSGQRKAA